MLSSSEIRNALQGCWMLFQNREEGLSRFDLSVDGFWRSFRVVFLLLIPLVVIAAGERNLRLEEFQEAAETFSNEAFWSAQIVSLAIDWVALPLVLLALARPLGLSAGYIPFIVVRNWSALLVAVPYTINSLLYLAGIFAPGIMVLASLSILAVALWYRYAITRMTLRSGVGLSIGIVVLDVILSLLISQLVGRLFGL